MKVRGQEKLVRSHPTAPLFPAGMAPASLDGCDTIRSPAPPFPGHVASWSSESRPPDSGGPGDSKLHRRRNLAVKILAIAILSQLLISGAQAQGLTGKDVGRTESGAIVLTLRQESNGTITGSLFESGVTTPVSGHGDRGGSRLTAAVLVEGHQWTFSGELRGSILTISLMGATLVLTRAEAGDEAATPPAAPTGAPPPAAELDARVNGVRLEPALIATLAQDYHLQFRSGEFWYDRRSGAWGIVGFPASGVVAPDIPMGGELRADASRGTSGVFVNGRELTPLEVAYLQQLGPVQQGRAWLDAQGNFGPEGGPAIGNLFLLAQSRSVPRQGVLSTWDRTGVAVFQIP